MPQAARPAKTHPTPIIDRIGPADPHVIRFEGKYYLYHTTWADNGVYVNFRGGVKGPGPVRR